MSESRCEACLSRPALDLLTERRLSDAKAHGRSREMQFLGNHDKRAKQAQIDLGVLDVHHRLTLGWPTPRIHISSYMNYPNNVNCTQSGPWRSSGDPSRSDLDMSEPIIRSLWESRRIVLEELAAGEPASRLCDPTRVAGRCTDIAGCPLKVLLDQHRGNAPNPGTLSR
jgi:hypothetical protein